MITFCNEEFLSNFTLLIFPLKYQLCYGVKKVRDMEKTMRSTLVFIVVTLFLTACNNLANVVNNVPEREANAIVVLLGTKNIPAEKVAVVETTGGGTNKEQLWTIRVPGNQLTEALAVLNQAGLPRRQGTSLLDLFGAQGLVPSDMQDRVRFQEGLSEQIANTIRMMDGVVDASVQITLPTSEDSKEPLTASVYIKHSGVLDNPNSVLVNKIKRLVSSALPGLTIENVAVITDSTTYNNATLAEQGKIIESEGLVEIWSLLIAKESLGRFRFIFYTFIILLFLSLSLIVWLIWKILPLIESDGMLSLFRIEQYQTKDQIIVEEEDTEIEE